LSGFVEANFRILKDFLNLSPNGMIVTNPDQQILIFNRAAERIFGYRAEEIQGEQLGVLIPYHCESCIVVSLRGALEREEMAREQDLWAQAFEHAEWGVVIGRAETTRLEVMNPAFARMYGYTLDELRGKPIEDVYAPEDRAKLAGWLEQAHEQGHIAYEARHIRKDGSIFPVSVDITAVKNADGDVLYRVVNVRDITQRKSALQALQDMAARYASIIAAMEEGVVLQDVDGYIWTCNASAERILGLNAEQMMGRTSLDPRWRAIHEDGSPFPGEEHPAMQTLHSGKPCHEVVMGVHKPEGTLTWISINSQPVFHPGKSRPSAVVTTFTDITERRRVYQMLEQRVEERTHELSALLEVSHRIASTLELGPLLRLILGQLKSVVEYRGAAIAILEDERFVILDYQGPKQLEEMVGQFILLDRLEKYREVALNRECVILNDLYQDKQDQSSIQDEWRVQMRTRIEYARSWMGIPLIYRRKLIGLLSLDHEDPNRFNEHDARLVLAFADQAALAIENARLYQRAQDLAALEERQRLARELHDSVSQAIYGIALGAQTARALLERDPSKAAEPLDYILSLAEAGLAEMRALIFELRPESLEVEGLTAALTKQAAAVQARHAIQVETQLCDEPQAPVEMKESLYRVAQEALQNVVKHAHASRIDLRLSQESETLTLEVRDNGEGFDTGASYPGHLGLNSMRERISQVGGEMVIESAPGHGSYICARIPIPAHKSV
jgi:PAS domain S-box-containing protein